MKISLAYKNDHNDLYTVMADKRVIDLLIDNFEGITETLVSDEEFDAAFDVMEARQKLVNMLRSEDE